MKKGTLKNYNIYLSVLLKYAKDHNVVVYDKPMEDDGSWVDKSRRIYISDKLTQKQAIAVLLHELGHYIDDSMHPEQKKNKRLNKAYELFGNKTLSKHQYRLIFACEVRAWKYGRSLAKEFKINLGQWFYTELKAGLNAYRSYRPK